MPSLCLCLLIWDNQTADTHGYRVQTVHVCGVKYKIGIFQASYFLLCWPLRSARTLLSCPLQMSRDVYEDVFECPSLLDKKPPVVRTIDIVKHRRTKSHIFPIQLKSPFSNNLKIWQLLQFLDMLSPVWSHTSLFLTI